MTLTAPCTAAQPEDTVLRRRLHRLAAQTLAPPVGSLAARLVQEIDEIVLPRIVTVQRGERVLAELHVAQRALVRIDRREATEISGAADTPGQQSAVDLARALLALSETARAAGDITLHRRPAPIRSSAGRVTGAQLHRALQRLAPATRQEALSAAATEALALCFAAPGTTQLDHGTPTSPYAPALEAALAQIRDATAQPAGAAALAAAPPMLYCLELSAALCLVTARQESGDLAMVLPRPAADLLQRAWIRSGT